MRVNRIKVVDVALAVGVACHLCIRDVAVRGDAKVRASRRCVCALYPMSTGLDLGLRIGVSYGEMARWRGGFL